MRDRPASAQEPSVRTRPVRRPAPKLGRALGPHLRRLAEASGAMDPRLVENWATLAGPELAKLCMPIRIVRRGKSQALEVSVKSGAAAMRVQYAQEALLSRVRQELGLPGLNRLTFREGKAPRGWEQRRLAAGLPAGQPERPARTPRPKSASGSLDEALARMRQTIHERDR